MRIPKEVADPSNHPNTFQIPSPPTIIPTGDAKLFNLLQIIAIHGLLCSLLRFVVAGSIKSILLYPSRVSFDYAGRLALLSRRLLARSTAGVALEAILPPQFTLRLRN
jgi:hypothetical protein